MFKHQGNSRTPKHNQDIAIALSFVAGLVNATGLLSVHQLTTNVTGHFSFFIEGLAHFHFIETAIFFTYFFSFLFGSFLASFLIEFFRHNRKLNVYVLPIILESIVLILVAYLGTHGLKDFTELMASLMLFAMGLQNSFVTKISNAVVRTTHLTGLFTDLGIELSQLFFRSSSSYKLSLKSRISLRLYIIGFFFLGGVLGVFFFSYLKLEYNTLLIAACILLLSLLYDELRYRDFYMKKRF